MLLKSLRLQFRFQSVVRCAQYSSLSLYLSVFHSTCKNRAWTCTNNLCYDTCSIYGDGHFNTFDKMHFNFDGSCEYTLVQVWGMSMFLFIIIKCFIKTFLSPVEFFFSSFCLPDVNMNVRPQKSANITLIPIQFGGLYLQGVKRVRITFPNCTDLLCLCTSQDHCHGQENGTFRIISENIPCGTTGTTCSKTIKLYLKVKMLPSKAPYNDTGN